MTIDRRRHCTCLLRDGWLEGLLEEVLPCEAYLYGNCQLDEAALYQCPNTL